MTVTEKISKARVELLLDFPWYGALAMNLKIEACESIDTFDVNGVTLRYNPTFADSLPQRQLVGVIAHEVGHCALLHMYRRGSRDPQQWNEAADYVINNELVKQGIDLPEGCLLDPQFEGLSAEVVYAKRAKQSQQQPQAGGQQPQPSQEQQQQGQPGAQPGQQQSPGAPQRATGHPQCGSGAPCPTGTVSDAPPDIKSEPGKSTGQMSEQDWEIAAEQAARVARAAGKLPGSLERMIQKSRESKTDWRTELREFLEQMTPSDYSWQRPNRRFINQGLYLPGTVKEGFGRLVAIIDVSGSVRALELNAFGSEVQTICEELKPEQLTAIYCDAAVQKVQEIDLDDVKFEACGGGGTRFQPAFDEIEKWDEPPKAVIYFTDLNCSDKPIEPDYPVLWVTGLDVTKEPEFGRAIRVEI